ncbi:hypothetical protein [Nocardia sp. NPDC058480]|uniref:NucA/NucB deoxyribonuclease domain-containing protein n=1 Tax=unclassified Nocardia TaxID=2637762 RepID=UPI003668FAE4
MYWHPNISNGHANQIGGAILDKWAETGYEGGDLGYPESREFGGGHDSRGNHFQRGEIYWSGATGAHSVKGEIWQTWAATDYENGTYGLPTTDEYDFEDGKKQDFQSGSIVWKPYGFPPDWSGDDDVTWTGQPNCATDPCAVDAQGSANVDAQVIPITLPIVWAQGIAESAEVPNGEPGQPDRSASDVPRMLECAAFDAMLRAGRAAVAEVTWCINAGPTPATANEPSPPATKPESAPAVPQPSSARSTPPTTASTSSSPSRRSGVSSTIAPPTSESRPVQGEPIQGPAADIATPPGVPQFCESVGPDPTGQADWHGNSTYGCVYQVNVNFLAKDNKGNPIGSITGKWERNLLLQYNKTDWTANSIFTVTGVSGVGTSSSMKFQYNCFIGVQPCAYNGPRSTTSPVSLNRTVSLAARPFVYTQPSQTLAMDSDWQIEIVAPNVAPGGAFAFAPQVRCDAAPFLRNTQGCTFTDVIPVLDFAGPTAYAAYRAHVEAAQRSGLPGALGSGALHRETDKATIDAHRRASCGVVTGPRPTGQSCDEYPMASTAEGAALNSYGRSYTNPVCSIKDIGLRIVSDPGTIHVPTGFSVCNISASENSGAGSILSWFYTKNRVRDGDPFYVNVRAR